MRRDEIKTAGVIVWVNYGSEGWQPRAFNTREEAAEAIQAGEFHGEIIATLPLALAIGDPSSRRDGGGSAAK